MTQKNKAFVMQIEEEIQRQKEPLKKGAMSTWEEAKTRQLIRGLEMALDIFEQCQDDDYDEDWI